MIKIPGRKPEVYEKLIAGVRAHCSEANPDQVCLANGACGLYLGYKIKDEFPSMWVGGETWCGFGPIDIMMDPYGMNNKSGLERYEHMTHFMVEHRRLILPNRNLVHVISLSPPKYKLARHVLVKDLSLKDFVSEQVKEFNDKTGLEFNFVAEKK